MWPSGPAAIAAHSSKATSSRVPGQSPAAAAPPADGNRSGQTREVESGGGGIRHVPKDEAFKILAVENLAGFGWSITVEDMVDMPTVDTVFDRLLTW
jgi:hypothetical protein